MQLSFTVLGSPVGQGSKRHVGNGVMIESPKLKPWRQAVAYEASNAMRKSTWSMSQHGSGPIGLSIDVGVVRPASHFGKKGLKPSAPKFPHRRKGHDLDKVARGICDALTGVVFVDDKQVISLNIEAEYAATAGVAIEVECVEVAK